MTRFFIDKMLAAALEHRRFADAEPPLSECLTTRVAADPTDWQTAHARTMLGSAQAALQRHAEAEPLFLAGRAGLRAREADFPPATAGITQQPIEGDEVQARHSNSSNRSPPRRPT